MIGACLMDRYQLVAELGHGGMGVVYLAKDPVLDRQVAVKMLAPGSMNADTEERLRREARVVAKMDHPSITPVFDLGHHQGSLFLVMPVLQGETLRTLLDAGKLVLGEALRILAQVADALDYSHAKGVVHRDIKPENVMVGQERGEVRVRVMDFGLARDPSSRRSLSHSGGILGTLAYMSPEQVQALPLDHRADIYALGALIYECLCGRPPFIGPVHQLIIDIAREPAVPASEHTEVDPELDRLVSACLEKDPAGRPESGRHVAEVLRACTARLGGEALTRTVATAARQASRSRTEPVFGRDFELAELESRLISAMEGEGQLVMVEGEAGVGKTRLLEELGQRAEARGVRVLRGRVADSPPYQVFCELVQDYFRTRERMSRGTVSADFSDIANDLVSLFPVFAEIEELRSATALDPGETSSSLTSAPRSAESPPQDGVDSGPSTLGDGLESARLYELLARTLLRLAAGAPLLVLLDNLDRGDATLGALDYVLRRLGPTPTLVVGTFRSGEAARDHPIRRLLHAFDGDPQFLHLTLGPLDREALRQLIAIHLAGGRARPEEVRDDLVERLHEASEGNPLFALELVKSLRDSEEIRRDSSGAWTIEERVGFGSDALPQTIQQAVERHLDRLGTDQQQFLQWASVLGRSFDFADLEAMVEDEQAGVGAGRSAGDFSPDADLDTLIDQLIEEGIFVEDRRSRGDRLAFASGLVRDVLYQKLPRRRRRRLHRRIAQRLEARHAGRLERVYSQLLHHCAEGEVAEKAVVYGLELAKRAVETLSHKEALMAASTALEFIDEDGVEQQRFRRGSALALLARAERAIGRLDRALQHAEQSMADLELDHREEASEAALLAAETAWQARRGDDARRLVEAGAHLARRTEAHETLRRLLTLGATIENLRGEHRRARRYLDEVELLGERLEDAVESFPRGGELVLGFTGSIDGLDPPRVRTSEEVEVTANIFQTLLTTEDGHPAPGLAVDWSHEIGADGSYSVELRLRPGVRFSDGHPLDAAAVKASVERAVAKALPSPPPALAVVEGCEALLRGDSRHLEGVEILAEDRLRFRLRKALPIFPTLLTHATTAIVRETREGLVGTGPFLLEEMTPLPGAIGSNSRRLRLVRSPHTWQEPARLDSLEVLSDVDPAVLASGARAGQIDIVRDLYPDDLENLLRDAGGRCRLVEVAQKGLCFALFNLRGPLARNAELRRVLIGLARPEDLAWRTLGRFAQPAAGLVPPGLLGHDPGRRRSHLGRAEGAKILRQAGLGRIRLRAAVHPALRERFGLATLRLFDDWRSVNVDVEVEELDMAAYQRSYRDNAHLDLLVGRWIADVEDPDDFAHRLFHGREGLLRAYFSSAEGDELLERARVERDPAERSVLYRRFQDLLDRERALLPLFHELQVMLAGPRARGLRRAVRPPYVRYERLARAADVPTPERLPTGGELHVAFPGRLESLDPARAMVSESVEAVPNVFETLTRVEDGARIEPWLAEKIETLEAGRLFRIRLRSTRFHGGRQLTTRDLRYSFERLLTSPRRESHFLLLPVLGSRELRDGEDFELAGLRLLSERDFEIELERPLPFFPALLSHPLTSIVPEGCERFVGPWRDGCAGTGPFRVTRFTPGERLEMERNPDYWRSGFPKADRLVCHFGISPDRSAERFREGGLSLASDLRPAEVEDLRRDPALAAGYLEQPRLATYFLVLVAAQGPFADVETRRAFAAAVSSRALTEAAGRLVVPARGLIPPGLLGASADMVSEPAVPEPPTDGTARLRGLHLRAVLHPVFGGTYAELWQRFQYEMRATGVEIDAMALDPALALGRARAGAVDLVAFRWVADYPDTDGFVGNLLHSEEGSLEGICTDPEIDRLVEQGRKESDPGLRHACYRELEDLLAREARIVPLFHEQIYRFCHPKVRGFRFGTSTPEVRYDEMYIER